jgi:hypothetical protein
MGRDMCVQQVQELTSALSFPTLLKNVRWWPDPVHDSFYFEAEPRRYSQKLSNYDFGSN